MKFLKPYSKPPVPTRAFLEKFEDHDYVNLLLGLAKEYGPLVKLNRFVQHYLISGPELAHHILVSERGCYVKEPMPFKRLGKLLGKGLLTNLEESWFERRRYLQKAFQREQLAIYEQQAIETTTDYLQRWHLFAKNQDTMDLGEEMLKLTMTLTCKSLFSKDLMHDEAQRLVRSGYKAQVGIMQSLLLLPWVFTRKNVQFFRARASLHSFSKKIIHERLSAKGVSQDLVGLLLDDENYRQNLPLCIDEMTTFLVAGHETTGVALTWMWHLVSQHPLVFEKIKQEVDRVVKDTLNAAHLAQLPFCKQVFEETLRLYPPIWGFPRRAVHPTILAGFPIPSGAKFILSPYVMHRLPAYWDEPDAFIPERFGFSRREHAQKPAYMPFGGGPHICIASQLALRQAVVVLAAVVKQFAIEVVSKPPGPMPLELLVSLRPGQKILAKVHVR